MYQAACELAKQTAAASAAGLTLRHEQEAAEQARVLAVLRAEVVSAHAHGI